MATWLLQDTSDSVDGQESVGQLIRDEKELCATLAVFVLQEPRVLIVNFDDAEWLHIGIGGPWAFFEHGVIDPWKSEVAVCDCGGVDKPESVWFAYSNQGSEIPAYWLIPVSTVIELVAAYFRDGELPTSVLWEEV